MSSPTLKRSARANPGVKLAENPGDVKVARAAVENLTSPPVDDKFESMSYSAEESKAIALKADITIFEDTKICDAIRQILSGELKDINKKASSASIRSSLVGLRNINRLLQLKLKSSRDCVAAARQSAENKHLALENLLYEVGHLEKQIAACRSFRSRADDIPLVSIEEFYKNAPESISRPAETRSDDHALFKARLSWELEQRKMLADQLKSLHGEIETVNIQIENKKNLLNALRPRLKAVIDASSGLSTILNTEGKDSVNMAPLSCPARRSQVELSTKLPQPLFAIYVKLQALLEVRGNNQDIRSVEIVPAASNNNADLPSKPHELAVLCVIRKAGVMLQVIFSCYPAFGDLLLAESKLSLIDENGVQSSTMISEKVAPLLNNAQLLLSNLLHHSHRSGIPSNIRRRLPDVLKPSANKALSLAYPWLFTFSGALPLASDSQAQVEFLKSAHTADRLVDALSSRAWSRLSLINALLDLDDLQLPSALLTANISIQFPSQLAANVRVLDCSLVGMLDGSKSMLDLAAANQFEVNVFSPECSEILSSLTERGFYYRIKLEKTKVILVADIFLPAEYPNQWPLFFLTIGSAALNRAEHKHVLEQIETVVNVEIGKKLLSSTESLDASINCLFSAQICQVAACWDTLVCNGSFNAPQTRQQHRGRDRSTAWQYDPDTCQYTFRESENAATSSAAATENSFWKDQSDESSDESEHDEDADNMENSEKRGERLEGERPSKELLNDFPVDT